MIVLMAHEPFMALYRGLATAVVAVVPQDPIQVEDAELWLDSMVEEVPLHTSQLQCWLARSACRTGAQHLLLKRL